MGFKRWLFTAVFLFAAGLAWGLVTSVEAPDILTENAAALEEIADFLVPLSQPSVFLFIYAKNVAAVLVSFALSPVLCLVPVVALVLNGGLIGLISVLTIQEKSLAFLLAGVLPHGIFELPALIIGEAAALNFGAAVIAALFRQDKKERLLTALRQNARYLLISAILLFPAALIETYLTPLLLPG
jgi:stage II sporulation protein M